MTDRIHAVILALVQGLTEFLPISSSAHLILVPRFLGWIDQGIAFDVAVHFGTLLAVVWYFRADLNVIATEWIRSVGGGPHTQDSRLGWAVILATIPVGLAGLLFEGLIETHLRSPVVIATATAVFGILLWAADLLGRRVRSEHQLTRRDIVVVGLAQALALIPGTSRSGITMTAAMALGLTRSGAARFSFLLSIPVIVLAAGLKLLELLRSPIETDWSLLLIGLSVSSVSAYLCIGVFLRFLERTGMAPFALYRLVLAGVLFYLFA